MHGRTFANILDRRARQEAPDGMDVSASEDFQGSEIDRLAKPLRGLIEVAVNRVGLDLTNKLRAPHSGAVYGAYTFFPTRAAGVFFHEIFGHRVEGHRQKDEAEGQTFTKAIGTPVLPDFLSVTFDPTKKSIESTDLNGTYSYDDEGVKGRPLTVVENGILKTFLISPGSPTRVSIIRTATGASRPAPKWSRASRT